MAYNKLIEVTENVVEGNELIAKFMCLIKKEANSKFNLPQYYAGHTDGRKKGGFVGYPDQLRYNSRWEWIMPVCYKWDNIFKEVAIDHDIAVQYENLCDLLDNKVTCYEILPVFKQLVENIIWFNTLHNLHNEKDI